MKKGFTLIELLAVVAILAIIMIIATPRIMDAIENSRIRAYRQDEQMMIKATQTYLGNNTDQLPENIGDTIEVTITDLKTNEFIGEVSDQTGDCNGYILVTKTEEGYSYNPQLKCGTSNLITSSTDDGLIAHYDFDEFAESTENLIIEPVISEEPGATIQPSYWLTLDPTYIYGNIEYGIATDSYNGNGAIYQIQNTVDYHTRWDIDWDTSAFDPNKYYTFSIMAKTDDLSKNPRINFDFEGYDSGGARVDLTKTVYFTKENEWEKMSITGKLIDKNFATIYTRMKMYFYADGYDVSPFKTMISSPQMEEKDYFTPFVDGTRLDVIEDKSLKNNDITISVEKNPQWVEENGNGYYYFDGSSNLEVNNVTDLTSVNGVDKPISFSMWVKANAMDNDRAGIINFYGPSTTNNLVVGGYDNPERLRIIYWQDGGTYIFWDAPNIKTNWYFISVTISNNEIKAYQNGELVGSKTFTNPFEFSDTFLIGKYEYGSNYYQGWIDNVKVYTRELSVEEIKYQYDTNKGKYE